MQLAAERAPQLAGTRTLAAFRYAQGEWTAAQLGTPRSPLQTLALDQTGVLMDAAGQPVLIWSKQPSSVPTFVAKTWTASGFQGLGTASGVIDDPSVTSTPSLRTRGLVRAAQHSAGLPVLLLEQYDVNTSSWQLVFSAMSR